MRAVSFAFVTSLFIATLPALTQGEDQPDRQALTRAAVEKAVAWMQDRGENWQDSRQCASCHHVPLMTWALHEAQKHGVAVDDAILKDATDWFFAEGDPAKVFQPAIRDEEEYSNPLALPAIYVAWSESNDPDAAKYREPVRRVLQSIADAQEPDGSWKPFFGRKPILGSREALTLWLTNMTSWPEQPEELRAIMAEPRRKAMDWIATHRDDTDAHVAALRLWMLTANGGDAEQSAALIEDLIKRQHEDGGWSQTEPRASDAYATGHVLYAFQIAGVDPNGEPMRRGVDFLLKTQAENGSWNMISRENPPILTFAVSAVTRKLVKIGEEPPMNSPSRNSEPISFIATAWATAALSRLLP
jgi:hypothetical protein